MRTRAYLRQMVRESRGSRARLIFFVLCLAVGVAAVVAVAGLTSSLELGIRREARQLLAADLALQGRAPLPAEVDALLAARPELDQAAIKEMVSVVAAPPAADGTPGRSQVVELKAVTGGYPFYGELVLDPTARLAELLDARSTAVAPDLPPRLGVGLGDDILIGGEPFRIAALVRAEPDRGADAFTLGPRVFVSAEGLARAGLEGYGSRITHRRLLRTPASWGRQQLAALAEELRGYSPRGAGGFRVETYAEAQPALRQGLRQVDRYLSLLALLSLLLGGVGVAQTTRSWLDGRTDSMAILRSLGFRPREVTGLYLGQTLVLGLVGSAVGVALGIAVQRVAPVLLGNLLPAALELRLWQPGPALRGLALGTGIALLFSLAPLAAIRRVPPMRVLRRDVEPLPASRWSTALTYGGLALGVWLAAAAQARSALLGLLFAAGIGVVIAVLTLGALALVRLVAAALSRPTRSGVGAAARRKTPASGGRPPSYPDGRPPADSGGRGRSGRRHRVWLKHRVWLRHGLAAIARPGAGTVGAIVAVGLGVVLLLAVALVERTLTRELTPELEQRAPTAFMIDIQPDQWPGVRALLDEEGASRVQSVPVTIARLASIDGRRVGDIARDEGRDSESRWALTREQRLTYMDELPADNRIVEGGPELWSDPGAGEVSVERDFARDLGVGVGSELVFDIQGVELPLRVTSVRTVDWQTFDINFFLVAEPEALAGAPGSRLATAKLPPEREQRIQDRLAAEFPNVTLIQIGELLSRIREVLGRLARGVQFLGAFTVLAGIVILAGAISAATLRRSRELALLKTLGMTRRGVAAMLAVEFALLGLVAGALGTVGGLLLGRTVITVGMDLAWRLEWAPPVLALAASVALTALTGVLASGRALQARPIEVLRSE